MAVSVKLALFDDYRLGRVSDDGRTIVDVTAAVPWYDPDPLSGWWRRLCRDFERIAPALAAFDGTPRRPSDVHLRAPVLAPGKVIGCAINYRAHAEEMRETVLPRTGADSTAWMLQFDVFLKAPSSIVGPGDRIVLPERLIRAGKEVHHESELTLVIGQAGSAIGEHDAMRHVLGYMVGLDITERGEGDRSRRKSWDTFTPVGPWMTTADEIDDPGELTIHLEIAGTVRQHTKARDMIVGIPGIIAFISGVMSLEPGDVILTGAPPGVGEIRAGDVVEASIDHLGSLRIPVAAGPAATILSGSGAGKGGQR